MKFVLLSISTIILFPYALAVPFRFKMAGAGSLVRAVADGGELEPCRYSPNELATCVDEKLRHEGSKLWCSYRLCAPSYIPAEACPAIPGLQATDKCTVKEITRDTYKCDGMHFSRETSPEGCQMGSDDCKEINTCSCKKADGYTSTFLTRETSYSPDCETETKVNVDCAKCGQVLECYVNSGSSTVDTAVCEVILDESLFCPDGRGRDTVCKQQCKGREGVKCFPGESWDTCPAVLGSLNGAAKCKGGARGDAADLSNFASYTISSGATKEVKCLNQKCDTGSTCACAGI